MMIPYPSSPNPFSGVDVSPFFGILGRRWRGKKASPAIKVGTTALVMTTATRKEYCSCVTMLCEKSYNAEIVPNVSPVDIINV